MVQLRDYTDDDHWLAQALESDPEVMKDLGGPTPPEKIQSHHERRLKDVLSKSVWYLTICPETEGKPVGTIGLWSSEWDGSKIHEMGWMILPAFQGRGYATAAGRSILERARDGGCFNKIYAFPAANNGASNAICKKLGFTLIKGVALSYNGPPQPTNLWMIDLAIKSTR